MNPDEAVGEIVNSSGGGLFTGYYRNPDADAERVNIPADPHHYWRYRMHLCIEDLIEDKEFKQHVTELVLQAGRR